MAHDAALLEVNLASVFAAYRERNPGALMFAQWVLERVSNTRAAEKKRYDQEMARINARRG